MIMEGVGGGWWIGYLGWFCGGWDDTSKLSSLACSPAEFRINFQYGLAPHRPSLCASEASNELLEAYFHFA